MQGNESARTKVSHTNAEADPYTLECTHFSSIYNFKHWNSTWLLQATVRLNFQMCDENWKCGKLIASKFVEKRNEKI